MVPLLIALMLSIACGMSEADVQATVVARYAELTEDEAIQLVRNHIYENASSIGESRLKRLEPTFYVEQTGSHWAIDAFFNVSPRCRFTVNKSTNLVAQTGECYLMDKLNLVIIY